VSAKSLHPLGGRNGGVALAQAGGSVELLTLALDRQPVGMVVQCRYRTAKGIAGVEIIGSEPTDQVATGGLEGLAERICGASIAAARNAQAWIG